MAERHDAFISYSHAVDGKLAAALERGLEKLAKPLLKLRALDVFRDQTSLTASPALWPGIVAHLEVSEWLLLLASPASAASVWCHKEVQWWLDHRSANRMLVLLTEGDIFWDAGTCDFDWSRTTAVPRLLERRCEDEPLYVDLRWARASELLSLRSAQFRDAVVNVASPIRGVPKDELDGADLRQLARNRLLVRGGVAAITIAAGVAVWQAIVANQQRMEAERQRDIAIARQLGAQAELLRTQQSDRLPLALLMATESARAQPESIETQRTLRGVLAQFPLQSATLEHGAHVTSGTFSNDMSLLATAAANDAGALWKLPEGTHVAALSEANRIVAFSPDDTRIVGCCQGVTVWDRNGDRQFSISMRDLRGEPQTVAFSADSKFLAVGIRAGKPGFAVFEVATGELIKRDQITASGNATAIAFGTDGSLYFAPRDRIQIHRGSALESTATLNPGIGALDRLAVDPKGRYLAASSQRTVVVFDLRDSTIAARLLARGEGPGEINHLAFDVDGRYLGIAGELDTGEVWKVGAWQPVVRASHGEFQTVNALTFDPSRPEAVSCGTDGNCYGWSLKSGQRLHQFGHEYAFSARERRQILTAAFSSKGSTLVTGGTDGTARLWTLAEPGLVDSGGCRLGDPFVHTFISRVRGWGTGPGDSLEVRRRRCVVGLTPDEQEEEVQQSPGGEFAAIAIPTDQVRVFDARNGKPTAMLPHNDPVNWSAVDARLKKDGLSERPRSFALHRMQSTGSTRVIAVSPSGRNVATTREADQALRIWDTRSVRSIYSEPLTGPSPVLLEFLSESAVLRVDPPGTLSLRTLPAGSITWSAEPGPITAVTYTSDRRLVAVGAQGSTPSIHVWEIASGRQIFEQSSTDRVHDLVFDASGRYLVALGPDPIVPVGLPQGAALAVWDVEAKRALISLPEEDRTIALTFSSDGRQFATMGYTGQLRVWNLADGQMRRAVTADPGPVAFSADGRWIAMGGRSILVLESASLQPVAQLDTGGEIRDIEFSDSDTLIAARRFDEAAPQGTVEVYRWRTADLLTDACRRMPLAAAENQWRQLLPEQRVPSPCASSPPYGD
ncbi:hypothetical protein [Mesorhizobium escarrei]|uniref:TIR domain-containing protein n=1 Tax=Mesorhizobium escarrei TaxID=666018 RepID=A0ABN8JED5_9HYPH|nr:hypothetical protein [Mesorhizobium escarrei]CAH2396482.1 conserved hypothetical protein [Mesorhizobium escarrei]